MKSIALFTMFILNLSVVLQAHANLMISPTRINFDSRDRVQEVILINSGTETRTYRLGWKENKATPEGSYEEISLEDPSVDAVSPYIRFSPRQVRLAPGERQVIKLQLRKRPGMDSPEYRSHLLFTALPPEVETSNEPQQATEGVSFKLNLLMNYTIPVLYHPEKGNVAVNADFDSINVRKDSSADINFKLFRQGNVSAFGRLEMFANVNGEKKRIGLVNNMSVFRELDYRIASVRVPQYAQIADQINEIELKYVGEKEHIGQVFTQKTFPFSATVN